MPDRRTLAETEKAMSAHVSDLTLNFPAAAAVSSLYRAANAVRVYLTNSVLREHGLTWTGFVVLWVVWIWDGMETRHAAEKAAISKATLTGVVKTLEARGLITRRVGDTDRRLVNLELTPAGVDLMKELYPVFNAAEAEVVAGLSPRKLSDLTNSLRSIVTELEAKPAAMITDAEELSAQD
jgi:MarR family transcriptional regulator, organic hydroperoxide resistance regulator